MQIEMIPINDVTEYATNPRRNEAAVGAVAESIKTFGFKVPIIIDRENVIVAGHTRVHAARRLGMTEVPAIRADDLTPEQVRAFRLADNKLHELSTWDMELLPLEIRGLREMDFDLEVLGFDADELGALLAPPEVEGLTDPDEVPEPPDEATTRRGDLWLLGDHRLLCGDSGSTEDVDRLLDGQSIHLVNTDPPYNVKVEPRSNNAIAAGNSSFTGTKKKSGGRLHHQSFDVARHGKKKATSKKLRARDRPLINDFMSDAEFENLLAAWFGQIARVLLPGRAFYVWGGYANVGNYPPALSACGLYFSQSIIWHKQHPVLTRKDFMGDHEWCFYGWKEGKAHKFLGPNNVPDVWSVKKVNPQSMVHLTEKPVELAARAIQYSSRSGENVLDLFGGSGSTLIACEQHGRRAYLMELDMLYADIIVQRWERFTGKKAKRVKANTKEAVGA